MLPDGPRVSGCFRERFRASHPVVAHAPSWFLPGDAADDEIEEAQRALVEHAIEVARGAE